MKDLGTGVGDLGVAHLLHAAPKPPCGNLGNIQILSQNDLLYHNECLNLPHTMIL